MKPSERILDIKNELHPHRSDPISLGLSLEHSVMSIIVYLDEQWEKKNKLAKTLKTEKPNWLRDLKEFTK